jgi:methionine synthase / methylenetetrahydrofolate reductase(NADPH)
MTRSLQDFRTTLAQRAIVGDGAMATWLHATGVPVRTCYEHLCLTAPNLVEQVHKAYVKAGATLLQTNTFSGHRPGLARYGLEDEIEAMNQSAVCLAKRAAEGKAYVFGTIGSILGLRVSPGIVDDTVLSDLEREFTVQAKALLTGEPDGILLETFADHAELELAVRVVRQLSDVPIIANLSPEVVGVTRDGLAIQESFTKLREAGADVVGLNCRLGPSGILRTYEGLVLHPEDGYAAIPNAGMLHLTDGDVSYTGNAQYFAEVAARLVDLGVRLVGGCCGTTPEHIAAVVRMLQDPAAMRAVTPVARVQVKNTSPSVVSDDHDNPRVPLPSMAVEDTIVDRAQRQQTTVIVELDPPRTLDTERFLAGAAALQEAGADYVTLADNSLGSVRVSNMALGAKLQQMGIEPLVHVTCRDRNLIGQQSHLMGLSVLGIHHLLLVTGDPSRFGDLPGAASVYDTSSIELTAHVKRLNDGVAFSGQPLKTPSKFVVGTAFNPNVAQLEKAFDRLRRKVAAGADFVMTQPVFDGALYEPMRKVAEELGVPMFVGIMPLVSARNAWFLHNEVPGIRIPQATLDRMQRAEPEEAAAAGLAVAKELIDEALRHFSTLYLITPFMRWQTSVNLLSHIRDREKQGIAGKMRTFG